MTPEYRELLHIESEKAKQFKSKHHYSLREMGLNQRKIKKNLKKAIKDLDLEMP
jgi:predicted metal-dependent TIM-barrel fold hydrolase